MAEFELLESYLKVPVITKISGLQHYNQSACIGIILAIRQEQGELVKLMNLLTMRVRRLYVRALMRWHGYQYIAGYEVFPSLERPVVVFQSGTAAESYAVRNIMPSPGRSINSRLKALVSVIAGCHSAVAGETLIFRRSL
jgi:hypothetical protein